MSDSSQGPGWWLASDGKWYPPNDGGEAPGPDWWLASDGKWYPPVRSERPGPGWWLASDGKWYAPESRPNATTKAPVAAPPPTPAVTAAPPAPPRDSPATVEAAEVEGRSGRGRDKTKAARLGRVGRRRRDKTDVDASDESSGERSAPVAATPTRSEPVARTEVPMQDRVRPNVNEGVSPQDQIERRNQASRADASVLAAKRAQAASRALGALGALGEIDTPRPAAQVAAPAPTAARVAVPTAESVAPPAPVPATRPAPTPTPTLPPPNPAPTPVPTASAAPAASAPAPAPSAPPPAAAAPSPAEVQPPLLEVAGTADVDHTRDQLAIFTDRVELRDRLDRVRTSIKADDIIGVNVQITASGAVLSVESMNGPDIAATGLRAEQAEEARRLILAKTRPARVASMSTGQAAATPAPAPAKPVRFDGPELVGKLADLRRAGILTEEEYQQKLVLVRRLAAGEPAPQPAT